MTAHECRMVLEGADDMDRAKDLDAAFPRCACEPWALTAANGPGIPDDEMFARILTSPDQYDEATSTIITSKLTAIYSLGMSVIRQGASDDEITGTVEDLLNKTAEVKRLVGAVVAPVSLIRQCRTPGVQDRWFGAYATDDDQKTHHGDVFGVSANKKNQSKRRHQLAGDLQAQLIEADAIADLIVELRKSGI